MYEYPKAYFVNAAGVLFMLTASGWALAEEPAKPAELPVPIQQDLQDLQADWTSLSAAHNHSARTTDKIVNDLRAAEAEINRLNTEIAKLKGEKK